MGNQFFVIVKEPMNFHPISLEDNNAIVQLSSVATEIVKEHFDPIIGSSMNDYMIAMFQSVPAITQQLREGYRYWIVKDKDTILGFLAYYPRGDILYLSKFYLYKSHRNKGYAHQMLAFLIQVAKDNDLKAIELNVNRNNPAVSVYQRLGFAVIREEQNPIGNGYVMDDYVFSLNVGNSPNTRLSSFRQG